MSLNKTHPHLAQEKDTVLYGRSLCWELWFKHSCFCKVPQILIQSVSPITEAPPLFCQWYARVSAWLYFYYLSKVDIGHITFLLLSRSISKSQRGERGHATSPGPDPGGTQQLINKWKGNWSEEDSCVTFLLCPFHILSWKIFLL